MFPHWSHTKQRCFVYPYPGKTGPVARNLQVKPKWETFCKGVGQHGRARRVRRDTDVSDHARGACTARHVQGGACTYLVAVSRCMVTWELALDSSVGPVSQGHTRGVGIYAERASGGVYTAGTHTPTRVNNHGEIQHSGRKRKKGNKWCSHHPAGSSTGGLPATQSGILNESLRSSG